MEEDIVKIKWQRYEPEKQKEKDEKEMEAEN